MEDHQGKYIRLFGTLFLSFVGFIVSIALLLIGLRFVFGLLNQLSWFGYLYMVTIILIPAALFLSVYFIYFRRTKFHPSKITRGISYSIFSILTVAWCFFLISDIIIFVRHNYIDIGKYNSYNMIFLVVNVACIFLVGVLQALSSEKEKDWMEKHR